MPTEMEKRAIDNAWERYSEALTLAYRAELVLDKFRSRLVNATSESKITSAAKAVRKHEALFAKCDSELAEAREAYRELKEQEQS